MWTYHSRMNTSVPHLTSQKWIRSRHMTWWNNLFPSCPWSRDYSWVPTRFKISLGLQTFYFNCLRTHCITLAVNSISAYVRSLLLSDAFSSERINTQSNCTSAETQSSAYSLYVSHKDLKFIYLSLCLTIALLSPSPPVYLHKAPVCFVLYH
jgi:hypothetical protein